MRVVSREVAVIRREDARMSYPDTHILIVDDEPDIRALFELSLGEKGYKCHTAANCHVALEVLTGEPVQVALVDVRMPGLNGIILHQLIQENYPDVAVVFITGVDSVDTAVGLLKCGAFDYLVKPVTLARLHQVVEEALDRRNSSLEQREARAGCRR